VALTISGAIQLAQAAGFVGEQVVVIVAISLCECGSQACQCNPDCCPAGESCGVLQIYQPAHPGTRACALDPACAYRLAFQLSSRGTNFRPWTTYNNGCWLSRAPAVRAAMAANPQPLPAPPPTPSPWAAAGALALLGGGLALLTYARSSAPPGAS
jgi:hypothetical protein